MEKKLMLRTVKMVICLLTTQAVGAGRVDLLAVADCGAIPNDGLDDTSAIQNCIDQLQQAPMPKGGVIFFEKGVYTISTLKIEGDNIVLEGLGAATALVGTSEAPVIFIDGPEIAERNAIRNLHVTNREGGLKSSVGIFIRHAYWTVVESVLVDKVAIGIINGIEGGRFP